MEKCCFMYFQPTKNIEINSCFRTVPFVRNNHVSKAIYINGKIKKVSDTKFLGVLIDNNLNWTAHIKNRRIIKQNTTLDSRETLFKSLSCSV